MISRTKIRRALIKALDAKDPMREDRTRAVINYPMAKFRHALMDCSTIPQIMSATFEFPEDKVAKQLTTVCLKSESRIIRMTYDYRTDEVVCSCIGKDMDLIKKTLPVDQIKLFINEYFPRKKLVIKLKKSS